MARRQRRIPQRTCIGCREVDAKRAMIRIVRVPGNGVQIDPTGKQSGRGAYLHQRRSCWQAALRQKRVAHALKTELALEEEEMLAAYAAKLPEGPDETDDGAP